MVSIFLPTRKNSERVVNKNTKDFCGIQGGLLKIKLLELLKVKNINEIVLSTNDESSIEVADSINNPKIKIIERPNHLCLSETKLSDLISYVPTIIENETILWTHVTSPFVNAKIYEDALNKYKYNLGQNEFDSLASVSKIQQYLWDNSKMEMINFNSKQGNWPRTQDLQPLYEINSAFFINSRSNYIKFNNRISPKMDIYELDKISQIDIDWEEDFYIAEIIYKNQQSK